MSKLIKVTVKLYGTLRSRVQEYDVQKGLEIEINEGSSYKDIVMQLHLPLDEARLIIVNGISKQIDNIAVTGEEINLFLPLGGG